MINKIVASYIFIACLFAISLYLSGVQAPIHLSTYFQAFLRQTSIDFANFKIAIPDIPLIDVDSLVPQDVESGGVLIIDWFIAFVNGFFNFVNILIKIINILSTLINTVLQVIEFLVLFLKNLIIMRNSIVNA